MDRSPGASGGGPTTKESRGGETEHNNVGRIALRQRQESRSRPKSGGKSCSGKIQPAVQQDNNY